MAAGQVAKRYANAWLFAASDKKALEAVSTDCQALLSMIRSTPEFAAFLGSPLISTPDQTKAITAIAKKANFNAVTVSFLSLLAAKRRMAALPDILDAASAMFEAAAGTLKASVTSATVLDDTRIANIRDQLSKVMGAAVAVETHVDPSIIGGLVVRVGSKMIDDSVKTKLDRMARRLLGQNAA